jgi:uncharacterized protein YndB with AHSA1/START domain
MPTRDVVFEFDVDADRIQVVDALTTVKGIEGWWTDKAVVPRSVGEVLLLTFPGATKPFELELTESSDQQIVWATKGFPPNWEGTRMVWKLASNPDGPGTRIDFGHVDWDLDDPGVGHVAYTWGQLMVRLKQYVETGKAEPFFVS